MSRPPQLLHEFGVLTDLLQRLGGRGGRGGDDPIHHHQVLQRAGVARRGLGRLREGARGGEVW
jgi:hypothetical protein